MTTGAIFDHVVFQNPIRGLKAYLNIYRDAPHKAPDVLARS